MGGEGRENQQKACLGCFRTDTRVTCGDLTLPSSKRKYNKSDAASEVS
jgi:hypothetical protein